MAVYSSVSYEEACAWLERYPVGKLSGLQGIASGVENTNYFVTTDKGQYVLTIFEKLGEHELGFYLNLMGHLALRGVPCPAPVRASDGALLGRLKAKPAALVTRLRGEAVLHPGLAECAEVGAVLARMHLAAAGFEGAPENPRGAAWRASTAPLVLEFLDPERRQLLTEELEFQRRHPTGALPRGPVHADLFRDNVLFDGPHIGGVIDFYFAGVDAFLFDVAVTLNDWCINQADGSIAPDRAGAFLGAYRRERAFSEAEQAAWPVVLRAAALRFWLSRLHDFYLPRPGELVKAHDPEHFCRILRRRIEEGGPDLSLSA